MAPAHESGRRAKVRSRKFAVVASIAAALATFLGVSLRTTYETLSNFIPSQQRDSSLREVRRFAKSHTRWDDVTSDDAAPPGNSSQGIRRNNNNSALLDSDDEAARVLQIPNRTIALIHVGKSGGLTFRYSLKRRHWRPGNVLQRLDASLCHMWNCDEAGMDRATSFLFVVRNPVDRMISTYKYSHPDNCVRSVDRKGRNVTNRIDGCFVTKKSEPFYRECAPTLEDLASVPYTSGVALEFDEKCRLEAELYVSGKQKRGRSHHAFYNYRYYKSMTIDKYSPVSEWRSNNTNSTIYEEKEILVVRNEHMWQDAASLDLVLGGSGDFNTELRETHGSENYKNYTSILSNQGYRRLCCMLREEIQVFEEILNLAVNLNIAAKKQTMLDVERKCGVGDYPSRYVWAQTCRENLANSAIN